MLEKLGNIIEKRPWFVIIVILLITAGFASLIPSLEMKTSTEDFMPDDEIVNANQRVVNYFGQTGEILMVFVAKQNAQNVVTPKALREEYQVLKNLEDEFDEVDDLTSIAGFVDILCQIEFGDTLLNCTDEQISTAYNDMMTTPKTDKLKMMKADDSNEKIDFNPYPKLSKGKNIDSLDIKNYYIDTKDETLLFTIEVYLSLIHI